MTTAKAIPANEFDLGELTDGEYRWVQPYGEVGAWEVACVLITDIPGDDFLDFAFTDGSEVSIDNIHAIGPVVEPFDFEQHKADAVPADKFNLDELTDGEFRWVKAFCEWQVAMVSITHCSCDTYYEFLLMDGEEIGIHYGIDIGITIGPVINKPFLGV